MAYVARQAAGECCVDGYGEPTPSSGGWMCWTHWRALTSAEQAMWYAAVEVGRHVVVQTLLGRLWARDRGMAA